MMKRGCWMLLAVVAGCRSSAAPAVEDIALPAIAGAPQSADPALAVDPQSHDLLLAWIAGDSTGYHLYFARSANGGDTWSTPTRITQTDHEVEPHAEASPRLVAGRGAIGIFWPHSIDVPGRRFPASHLRFSRSADGGRTWSSAVTLNDDTARVLAGHTFHGATALGDSTFMVAWLDSRAGSEPHEGDTAVHHDGDATIYLAVSKDLGASWSPSNTRLWGDACPCCRVALVTRPDGAVVAAWRGHFDGSVRDPVIATVAPAPATPRRVSVDGWVFQGCPHTGPALASAADGSLHVAWFTGKEGGAGIFYSRSSDGSSFDRPVPLLTGAGLPAAHPAVLPSAKGALVAINLDTRGARALTIARVDENQRVERYVVPRSEGADHPQWAALPTRAVLAWTEKTSAGTRIRMGSVVN
jgi:hypothetical protein